MQFVPDIVAQVSAPSCASESIHIPGSIQPHGLLLLFDADSSNLTHWAGDFERILGIEPTCGSTAAELLGRPLDELVRPGALLDGSEAIFLGDLRPADRPGVAIQAHRTGRFLAIELQQVPDDGAATPALEHVRAISDCIAGKSTQAEACHAAAQEVRSITGFDRIMIYRFLEDGSGSVIAEARASKVSAYFNHRFPSSDIPSQARELYRRNLLRTIPDVAYSPVPIEPPPHLPVDMSHCVLRSVSPVHIQYLKNMDVGASMSISLLVDDKLWGLIACHHHTARKVPVDAQLLCRHVGTSLSAFILSCGQAEIALLDALQREAVESALRTLRSSTDPERTLRKSAAELKGLINCGGFALLSNGETVAKAGLIPTAKDLRLLAPLVESHLRGSGSYLTDRLGEVMAGAPQIGTTASGVMAVRLEASQPLLALWFRPEQVEEIDWAGDPGLKEEAAKTFGALTPRRSFATWRETVRGHSRPWMWYESSAADLFQSRANYTLQRHRLKQVNLQLAEANEGLSALATTDPLTGLSNRRLFDDRLHAEWERVTRQGGSFAVVGIDVDHFKKFNDCFGHPAGDECLKQVATAISSSGRAVDTSARLGGEEFAMLLPDVDARGARAAAERVRQAVEDLRLDHPQSDSKIVTISVGVAPGAPAHWAGPSELMAVVDRALYEAKAAGRNRVVVSA